EKVHQRHISIDSPFAVSPFGVRKFTAKSGPGRARFGCGFAGPDPGTLKLRARTANGEQGFPGRRGRARFDCGLPAPNPKPQTPKPSLPMLCLYTMSRGEMPSCNI